MNEQSNSKIKGVIGDTLRGLIVRDLDLTDRARVIDQKQKELTGLKEAYRVTSNLQNAEYESILEFIKLVPHPRPDVIIGKWREWYNYHPNRDSMGSSDFVMGKIAEFLSDEEKGDDGTK